MSAKEAYIRIKQRDMAELQKEADDKRGQGTKEGEKLRIACQSARVMLDRVETCHDADWRELKVTVDGAFRHAFDCMEKVKAQYD